MTQYLYGMHDPGGEHLFADKPGWIVFTEEIGSDPNDKTGRDYHQWSDRGFGVLVRVNNGYGSAGTIPTIDRYTDFAKRFANFVMASKGCNTWIVGNEPNHSQERPDGQAITPAMYIDCYKRVYDAVNQQAGAKHGFIPAPVALWNVETGDWLEYQAAIWNGLWQMSAGVAIHTYSHGASPALITSQEKMHAPFQERFYHFQAYRDLMNCVPDRLRGLPVYITETDQNDPWVNANTGWVQAAYAEIDRWNQTDGTQKIHCLALYRWPNYDQWAIVDKPGVHADLRAAVAKSYQVPSGVTPMPPTPDDGDYLISWDERLDTRGTQLGIVEGPGDYGWHVRVGKWYDEGQAQGRINVFVTVLDELDQFAIGVPVRWFWQDGDEVKNTERKFDPWLGHNYSLDFPMYNVAPAYGVQILGDTPSDIVQGLGLGDIERPGMKIHTAYSFTFQRMKNTVSQPQPPIDPDPPTQPPASGALVHPLPGSVITQHFYQRPEAYSRFGLIGHDGTDLAGVAEGTPIRCIADGVVAYVDVDPGGYGEYIRIGHRQLGVYSFYGHLQVRSPLRVGDTVKAGATIGRVGNTGNSTSAHLHISIRKMKQDGSYDELAPMPKGRVDPETWCCLHGLKL